MDNSIFGPITSPYKGYEDLCASGPTVFLTNVVKLVIVAAGLFAFINLIIAGFGYISSSGDPKATTAAWQKIYMSLIGLIIMVASFAVAVLIGTLLLGDPSAILSPTIYGPGSCQ
jgi:hypothetical protein